MHAACICTYILHAMHMHTGLGTSSILGGAIMGALWRASGQKHSLDSLVHSVSELDSTAQLYAAHPVPTGPSPGAAADHRWWLAGPVWRAVWRSKGLKIQQGTADTHTHQTAATTSWLSGKAESASHHGVYREDQTRTEPSPGTGTTSGRHT